MTPPAEAEGPRLVYGVVRGDYGATPRSVGVEGHIRFDTVVHGGVAAVTSVLTRSGDATPDDLRAYLGVLGAIMEQTTVLPMRFGMVFDGPEEVASQLLAPREAALAALLRRMEGMVEMRVRATYREAQVLQELLDQRADLAKLQRRVRGRPEDATYYERIELGRRVADAMTELGRRDAGVIEGSLGRWSEAVSPGDPPFQRQVSNASYLVDRANVARFLADVDRLRDEVGRLQLRASEAMPPFSFVDMELDTAGAGSGR
jgi:hypothetical protein